MRLPAAVALAAILASAAAGCLGGEARTEWAFEATQLDQLSDLGRTGRGVTVALLDTGIDTSHVALEHLVDGDHANGELVAFRDYIAGRNGVGEAHDDEGHGTHVAGIIAASGSSLTDKLEYGGVSLLGGAPGVRMVVARVCALDAATQEPYCNADAIPRAVQWALEQDADVISLSLGGVRSQDIFARLAPDRMSTALQGAIDRGVVVVAAAGNDGPSSEDVAAPSDIPDVISVGASQQDGKVWAQSNRGDSAGHACGGVLPNPFKEPRCDPNRKPEIVAPGVEILSAWRGGGYAHATGTSQATPFVTAAVALLLEGRPDLTDRAGVLEVKEALRRSAQPLAGQDLPHDEAAGYGLLQARSAYDRYR